MFNIKIKGINDLKRKISAIEKTLPKTIENSVEDILRQIRTTAIRLERGHHEEGILCELIDVSKNIVKGRVYADAKNFPFFIFEHYGTGQYAELEHIGKTEHFIKSGYTEWFIPVSKVDRSLNYPKITIQGQEFYLAHGFKANHFMTDSEFENRENNKEIIKEQILNMLKEVCK